MLNQSYPEGLPELLRKRASARYALQAAEDYFAAVEAQAETRATDNALATGTLGKNAEDRARALVVALDRDADFKAARKTLRDRQGDLWRLDAEIEVLHELRRDRDSGLRQRLIELAESGRLPVAL
jgi:hypothetical protein